MKIGIMKTEIRIKPETGCFCGFWIQKAVPWEGERIYKLLYKKTKELEYLWKDPQVDNWNDFYKAVLYSYMTKEILLKDLNLQEEYERIKIEYKDWNKRTFNKEIGKYTVDYEFLWWYEDYLREQADPGILEREKRQREVDAYIARTRYEREQAEREAHQVRCPYCNSTRTEKIGAVSRAVSISMTGLASGKIGKQWHCKDCKSDF